MGLVTTTTASSTADTVRLILYWDKQCNGATALVGDILTIANYQSFNKLSNVNRFRILMDRTHSINMTSAAGNGTTDTWGDSQHDYDLFIKVQIPIEFDTSATTGVITSCRSNNIGLLTISRAGLALLDGKMRLRFTDA